MGRFVCELPFRIRDGRKGSYRVSVYGEQRDDGKWEGWLEFAHERSGDVVMTARETTQGSAARLRYWARSLGATYLEGAFARAWRRFGKPVTKRRIKLSDGLRKAT